MATYWIRRVLLVLLDGLAVRQAVHECGVVLRVAAYPDMDATRALCNEPHQVEEWDIDERATEECQTIANARGHRFLTS